MFKLRSLVAVLFAASVTCIALPSCKDKAKEAREKATADSLRNVAREDSLRKAEAESAASAQAQAEASKPQTIAEALPSGQLSNLIQTAELGDALKAAGPFTVLAPTDEAFSAQQKDVDNWLKPKNKTELQGRLKDHVLVGKLTAADLTDGKEVKTLNNKTVKVKVDKDGKITIGDAEVNTGSAIEAGNGVIYSVNKIVKR